MSPKHIHHLLAVRRTSRGGEWRVQGCRERGINGIGEGFVQFARFITSLQLDQEPEETELAPCFLAYPTWLNAFAISVRALESSIVAGIL